MYIIETDEFEHLVDDSEYDEKYDRSPIILSKTQGIYFEEEYLYHHIDGTEVIIRDYDKIALFLLENYL